MSTDKLTPKEINIYKILHFFGIALSAGMIFWFYVFKFSEMTMTTLMLFMIPLSTAFTFGYAVKWDVRIIPGIDKSKKDK